MFAETPYSEIPELLVSIAPQYKKEHFHVHGRNVSNYDAFTSIFQEEHFEINKLIRKVLKGALLGLGTGFFMKNAAMKGPRMFESVRMSHQRLSVLSPLKGYAAYGGTAGFVWYMIHDQLCCSHGHDTYQRYLAASALMGSFLWITLYHPITFLYGAMFGFFFGGAYIHSTRPLLPKGFAMKLTNLVTQEQRAKFQRQDAEAQMSKRSVLTTRKSMYPL